MKNSILSTLLYKCKKFMEAFVLLFMLQVCVHAQSSPDYIFGDDNGSGWNWTLGTQGISGLGSSYKWQFQATSTTNQYFKLGESSSSTDGQGFWKNNSTSNMQYTGGGAIWNSYYNANMGADGSIYFAISSGKYYVLKAKKDDSNSNTNFSIQELSATPVTITGVTDNFQSTGTSMNVYITLSGSKSPEERVFVRYTTDNWATSIISSEATGSGTSYTAIIPGGGVTATANNKYYVFTTTVAAPSASEADLLAINYNNNSGNYHQVFSKYITILVDGWQTKGRGGPVMWSYATDTPGIKECGSYACGAINGSSVTAYVRTEFNVIGGTNGNNCDCSIYTGSGVVTTTSSTEEQTNLVSTTSGITFYLGAGGLSGFTSACPDSDSRVYTGSDGYLKVDDMNKLVFDSYRTVMSVNYQTGVITSTGWAKINSASSDPLWVKEFDPFNTGQIDFDAVSSSPVVQSCYGAYDITIKLKPAPYVSNQSSGSVATEGGGINETISLPSSDVVYNFTSTSFGGTEGNGVFANQIMTTPVGDLPSGIDAISQLYWNLSTALDTFTCSLTFDLADITGISNSANLRILKRVDSNHPWTTWTEYTLVDATHLRANNVTSLSEWAIGSTGGNALPVELVSFSGAIENNAIVLKWKTAAELNSYGFEIERRLKDCGCEWEKIGFMAAGGNSNSPKDYELKDFVRQTGSYLYRLKIVDNDGKFDYSKEVNINIATPLKYELLQNYPNPFNPVTTLKFALPEASKVTLKIFSLLGEEVAEVVNEEKPAGFHQVEFDASKLSSGVYFYKIETNNFTQIKKMSVIK